jgi:hypothetical protein
MGSAMLWRAFLYEAEDSYLRTSPATDVWTPIQYGAHVRDMLRVFGDRVLLAVNEENPSVPWFDPGPEGWDAYNRLIVNELAKDLEDQAERLAAIIGECRDTDWLRTANRDGVDRFTVGGLCCFAVHEAHHHLLDAVRGLPATG